MLLKLRADVGIRRMRKRRYVVKDTAVDSDAVAGYLRPKGLADIGYDAKVSQGPNNVFESVCHKLCSLHNKFEK